MKLARPPIRRGFTIVELLTVIGIIVLLVAILMPVVAQVRIRAYVANTQQEMNRLMTGIQAYYHDFNAYPGPLTDSQLAGRGPAAQPVKNIMGVQPGPQNITSSENLVMGLLYYLRPPSPTGTPVITFVPDDAAGATTPTKTSHDPANLNPLHPATYHYIDYLPDELSSAPSGRAWDPPDVPRKVDGSETAQHLNDTNVPEFLDKIPDPLPILYLRAKPGATLVVSNSPQPVGQPQAQYDRSQLAPYGFTQVTTITKDPDNGIPNTLPSGTPAQKDSNEWVNYFLNPNILGQAKGKDGFILISAGADRIYGTRDDIIVAP